MSNIFSHSLPLHAKKPNVFNFFSLFVSKYSFAPVSEDFYLKFLTDWVMFTGSFSGLLTTWCKIFKAIPIKETSREYSFKWRKVNSQSFLMFGLICWLYSSVKEDIIKTKQMKIDKGERCRRHKKFTGISLLSNDWNYQRNHCGLLLSANSFIQASNVTLPKQIFLILFCKCTC